MANEKPKKKGGIARKIYAFLIILLGIMILALGILILFHTQSIKVNGLSYGREQEIIDWIKEDKSSANTLYLLCKYNIQKPKMLPFVDGMKVRLKAPWAVEVDVREKKIVGYIEAADGYYFFDKKGLVVFVGAQVVEEVPRIDGMTIEGMTLYKKLKTADDKVFGRILEVTQLLKKEELKPDRITSDGKNITLYFGTISVELGSGGYAYKILQLTAALEKLQGQTGVLKMQFYNENSNVISFRKIDPNAVPDDTADNAGQGSVDGEGNSADQADGSNGDSSDSQSGDTADGGGNASLDYGDDIDSQSGGYTNGNDGEE